MKKLFFNIRKNLELIAAFVIFFLLSIPHIIDLCSGYLNYVGYDIQEFLLWNYSSLKNVTLYKDIFYPYGLLLYYRNDNLIFLILNYIITPLIFTIFFFLFRKIFKEKYFLYASSFCLFIFIFMVTGFETFSRYGILIAFSLLYAYLLYSKRIKLKLVKLGVGIIFGLAFSLINDQGSYLIFFYLFLYIFNEVINKKNKFSLKYCKYLFVDNVIQEIGFFLGLIPLLGYLVINNSFTEYFKYFKDVQNIAIVAKTPFFPFITSPANLFTITILFLAIISLLINHIYLRKKLSLSSYFQISLIFDILLLEQKSMIRSIDVQITFVSFILFIFLFYETIQLLNKYKLRDVTIKFLYLFILMAIILVSFLKFGINQFKYQDFKKAIDSSFKNECYINNLNLYLSENKEYVEIVDFLKSRPEFNEKVFSFSIGDSVLYTILGQKPPYYNAIFEGASQAEQLQTIGYIKNNNINFVTLDTRMKYIQDGVPDYIRQPAVFKYIVNNYYPIEKIGNHLILKKDNGKDFFKSELVVQAPVFKKYLLNIYLNRIPYSEGFYKYNLLTKLQPIVDFKNVTMINKFFVNNNISSKDKAIVFIPSISLESNPLIFFMFKTQDEYQTSIFYNSCKQNIPCIINLSKIPLFYKDRNISGINFDEKTKGRFMIFNIKDIPEIW